MSDLAIALVRLGGALRLRGVEVGPGRLQAALEALEHVDHEDRGQVVAALACTLAGGRDDIAAIERALAELLHDAPPLAAAPGLPSGPRRRAEDERPGGAGGTMARADTEAEGAAAGATIASRSEALRRRDFAGVDDDELLGLRRAVAVLARELPRRPARRTRPANRPGAPDHRATLRRALRTGGDGVERAWRERRTPPRPLVLLCDVSGSMAAYARPLLLLLHAALQGGRDVEAFAFGTRLTRLSGALAARDPSVALTAAAAAVPDWGGGTRIGESLRRFNREQTRRGRLRGAVVVIVSDGWERGDAALLGTEAARLARGCRTLAWLNPHAGKPGWRPASAGMRAVLPHLDALLACHDLATLEGAVAALSTLAAPRPLHAWRAA